MVDILETIDLPTQISSIHSLAWSQSNRIAVSTRRGVYIFILIPDPYNSDARLNFNKTFIANQPNSIQKEGLLRQERLAISEIELRKRIIQDKVLAAFTEAADVFSHLQYVGWTPKLRIGEITDEFLLTVSVDYNFRLYGLVENEWACLVELTHIILNYLKDNPTVLDTLCNEEEIDKAYEAVFKKAYICATLSVSWVEQNRFITGQEGGQIIFWSVKNREVAVDRIIQPGIYAVTALCSHKRKEKRIIFAGSVDGRVKAITGTKTQIHSVWDESDRLKVTQLDCYEDPVNRNTLTLIIHKLNFIIFLNIKLSDSKPLIQVTGQSVLNAGISHVVGLVPLESYTVHRAGHQKSASKLLPEKFVAVAHKGMVNVWNTKTASVESELDIRADRSNYGTWGLVSSPNKGIYCMLECVTAFNDHLLLREPARIIFFTFSSPAEVRNILGTSVFLPEYMELYRTFIFSKDAAVPSCTDPQCSWWFSAVLANKHKTRQDLQNLVELEAQLRCAAAATILNVASSEKHSKIYAANFILKYSQEAKMKSVAEAFLSSSSGADWKCRICSSKAEKETVRTVTCRSKHSWGRCGLSQQPCVDPNYLVCCWCGCTFSANTVSNCTLCTGPVR